MRVLVTRPQDDAEETAALLAARGHEAILAPLLDIRFRDGPALALGDVQAVLITSANGIRALARRTQARDVRVMAVGAQSAAAAHELRFAKVEHADGDAAALANLVIATVEPEGGALLHAAGADTRGRLAETLAAQGFDIRSEVLYDAVAAQDFPQPVRDRILEARLDAVLFYSPRTARIFLDLVARENLADHCRQLIALCISRATADEVRPLAFREIRVAAHPHQDSLLARIAE